MMPVEELAKLDLTDGMRNKIIKQNCRPAPDPTGIQQRTADSDLDIDGMRGRMESVRLTDGDTAPLTEHTTAELTIPQEERDRSRAVAVRHKTDCTCVVCRPNILPDDGLPELTAPFVIPQSYEIENLSDVNDPATYGIRTQGKAGEEELKYHIGNRHHLQFSVQGKTYDYLKRLAVQEGCTLARATEIALRGYQKDNQLRPIDFAIVEKGMGAITTLA